MATISDFLIRLRAEGLDKLQQAKKGMDDLTSSTNKTQVAADKLAKTKLDESMSKLGAAMDGAVGGSGRLASGLGMVGGSMGTVGMAAIAGVGAFAALGLKAINLADQIGDLSDATGISAGRLLNLKQSIIESGGKAEDFEKISAKLNQTIGEAANGNEKTRKSFRDLGIALGDANGKIRSTDDLLPEVLEALANIEEPAMRAATAVDLLGKAANKIDWTNVKAGKDAIKDEQIKQLTAYRDEMDKLANSIETNLITAFGRLSIAMREIKFPKDSLNPFNFLTVPFDMGQSLARQSNTDEQAKQMAGYKSRAGVGRDNVAPTGELAVTPEGKAAIASAQAQIQLMKIINDEALKYQQIINGTIGIQQMEADIIKSNAQIEQQRVTKVAELQKAMTDLGKQQNIDPTVLKNQTGALSAQIVETNKSAAAMAAAKEQAIRLTQQQANEQANLNQQIQFQAQDLATQQAAKQAQLIGLYGDELRLQSDLLSIENERANVTNAARAKIEALGERATAEDIQRSANEILQAQKTANAKIAIVNDQYQQNNALADLNQQIQFDAQNLATEQAAKQAQLIGLYGTELQLKSGLMSIENERATVANAARQKIEALGDKATVADIGRAANEIIQAQQTADAKVAILRDQLTKEEALKNDADAGTRKALYDIAEAYKPGILAQKQTQEMWGNVTTALDNFVETGKLKLGDFARSMVATFLKSQLQASANGLFTSMMGGGAGGAGIGALLKGLFGGFFAEGGQPPVGKASIVGEKGPELFIPRSAGTIIPNGAYGGNGQTINNNTYVTNQISALDSRSVAQLFAENRQTLLGVTEMARKELPGRQRL